MEGEGETCVDGEWVCKVRMRMVWRLRVKTEVLGFPLWQAVK